MQKEWFKLRLRQVGKTTSDLAEAIQRDRAVVSRILNGKQAISIDHAKAFATALDVPLDEMLQRTGLADPKTARAFQHGFSESDAVPWEDGTRDETVAAALGAGRSGIDVWTVNGKSMSLEGYLPGDRMLVDTHQSETCRAGDIVLAQSYDLQHGSATTVLRRYEPPVLIAASPDQEDKRVLVVDGSNVVIRGKIVGSWRT